MFLSAGLDVLMCFYTGAISTNAVFTSERRRELNAGRESRRHRGAIKKKKKSLHSRAEKKNDWLTVDITLPSKHTLIYCQSAPPRPFSFSTHAHTHIFIHKEEALRPPPLDLLREPKEN